MGKKRSLRALTNRLNIEIWRSILLWWPGENKSTFKRQAIKNLKQPDDLNSPVSVPNLHIQIDSTSATKYIVAPFAMQSAHLTRSFKRRRTAHHFPHNVPIRASVAWHIQLY